LRASLVELPAFARHRERYLDDEAFRRLQRQLVADPEAGTVLRGTGGLRKLRFGDDRRSKGKRGGLRVVYFWWREGSQIWLFTLFGKDEVSDLTPGERETLRRMLKRELDERRRG